jgi:hypothetical protein
MILKWDEYHDDKTNMDYELPHFTMNGYKSQDDFYHDNNMSVFSTVFSCIEFAILNKLEQVPCFILDNFVMTVNDKLFLQKLDECRLFFEQLEMYEKCADINKLKAMIK